MAPCRSDGRDICPEEWCADPQRRARATIPGQVTYLTTPELAAQRVVRARTAHRTGSRWWWPPGWATRSWWMSPFRNGPDGTGVISRFCGVCGCVPATSVGGRVPLATSQGAADCRMAQGRGASCPTPPIVHPARGHPARAPGTPGADVLRRSRSTTRNSQASLGLSTTRDARGGGGLATPPWVLPPTAFCPWSGCVHIPSGRSDTPDGRAASAAALGVLDRPLADLSATHRPRPDPLAPDPTG